MKNAQVIGRTLKQEGTEVAFCFPTSPLIEGAAAEGIRIITCRTERTVTNMADGYSRALNGKKVGVCLVQDGPGIENAYVGIAQAFDDSSPVLILPGGPRSNRLGLPASYDPVVNYRGVTKWAQTVNRGSRVAELMGRGFTNLRNGRLRPVLIEVPADIAAEEADEAAMNYEPVRCFRTAGDPSDVAEAIRMLLAAKRPVLHVGQGALWAEATPELVQFAELLPLPVQTTTLAKSVFPEDHPLSLGTVGTAVTGAANHFMDHADLMFCVGASLSRTLATTAMPEGIPIVHCISDEDDLNIEYRAAHAVIGDARLVLQQLIEEAKRQLGSKRPDGSLAAEIKSVKDAWLQEWMPKLTSEQTPLTPYRVIWDLLHTVDPRNTIITHDAGAPRGQLISFWEAPVPRSFLGWGNSHQLGSSLGLIMGAKLAQPDKLCICYLGDAGLGMCGMDLETASRERIPILVTVLNNSWMSGYTTQLPTATEQFHVGQITGDYCKVAEGLGCHAERVEQPKDIVPAIKRAISKMEDGRPALLEFMTGVESSLPRRTGAGAHGG